MRILVLDDQEILRKKPADGYHDYRDDLFIQTRRVRKFVDRFFRECWDEVWIDHDLNNPSESGRTATKEIYHYMLGSGRKPLSTPDIKIISMNVVGARAMTGDLLACGFRCLYTPISMYDFAGIERGNTIHI